MQTIELVIADQIFIARLEELSAPRTCEYFLSLLPYDSKVIHVRWSGEGIWIPWGDQRIDVPHENTTCHPLPGQMILYPGGVSESEVLLAYGPVTFASKAGPLAGNHFLTITNGLEKLESLGQAVLYCGSQPFRACRISDY